MISKFATVLISGTRIAQASVSPTLRAGDAASLLRIGGLEIATPVAMGDRLGGFGLAPGDRLGVFTAAPIAGDFPAPVRTGGREVTVHIGGREISTGDVALTMGVPDPTDLPLPISTFGCRRRQPREFAAARCATYCSTRGLAVVCGADGSARCDRRLRLTQQPLPVSARRHMLRFYTPLDDPRFSRAGHCPDIATRRRPWVQARCRRGRHCFRCALA